MRTRIRRVAAITLSTLAITILTTPITNGDYYFNEDSPNWDCRVNGNRTCGPKQFRYVPGCYSEDGILLESWNHEDHYAQLESPC